jgi:hypothetical protein
MLPFGLSGRRLICFCVSMACGTLPVTRFETHST